MARAYDGLLPRDITKEKLLTAAKDGKWERSLKRGAIL